MGEGRGGEGGRDGWGSTRRAAGAQGKRKREANGGRQEEGEWTDRSNRIGGGRGAERGEGGRGGGCRERGGDTEGGCEGGMCVWEPPERKGIYRTHARARVGGIAHAAAIDTGSRGGWGG
jgi:hypothetical protein